MKCLVHGCTNEDSHGGFVGELCAPCHDMLTTGQVGPGETFIHDLDKRPKLPKMPRTRHDVTCPLNVPSKELDHNVSCNCGAGKLPRIYRRVDRALKNRAEKPIFLPQEDARQLIYSLRDMEFFVSELSKSGDAAVFAAALVQYRSALISIRDHWACQYDHPAKLTPMYEGPYGVGVTDGHRAAARIAVSVLNNVERSKEEA